MSSEPKASWDSDVSDIMDRKVVPKLGDNKKDTAHRSPTRRQKSKEELTSSKSSERTSRDRDVSGSTNSKSNERVSRSNRARSRDDGERKPFSSKTGLRRCHTTDGADVGHNKRGSPKSPRRGRRPPSELTSSTTSQSSAASSASSSRRTAMEERGRSARSLSPSRTKSGTRSRSGSPKRKGERSPAGRRERERERERRRPEKLLGDYDEEDHSSSRSPSPSGGSRRKRSPNHHNKLPPKNGSNGSLRDRDRSGSPRNAPPATRRVPRSRQEATEKSSSGMSFRKGAIQARREKSARSLRRTKSHDDSSSDFNMSWRRKRSDMNASTNGRLGATSSNFLDSSLQSDDTNDDEVDIDLELEDQPEKEEDGNSHGRSTQGGRANSPRTRHRGLNRGGNNNISRNQLVRGIDLQDARVREEEEEEARKKRHQLKKDHRSRSPANRHQTSGDRERGDDGNCPSRSNNVFDFTTPKLTTPKIAVVASKSINDTAVAASQAANAASVATYQASKATYQAATAASQTAYQTAMETAAAASQAANVMSGAAARAAAALTFQTSLSGSNNNTNSNNMVGPAARPKQQKSTVSERELAARFNFNSKASSSAFGSSNMNLRESTNSDRNGGGRSRSQEFSPSRSQRSQEFTAGNGLQLF